MRYKPGQKEQTRERILDAAQRGFKQAGYSGMGVDGLASAAGVTSGAFYGHFPSKKAVFQQAVSAGLAELYAAIEALQQRDGDNWWAAFADFYTTHKRTCELADSCALQSLSTEVGRADDDIRQTYQQGLLDIVDLASTGGDRQKVWASLAMLVGGVSLARAVKDEKIAEEIAEAVKQQVMALHDTRGT